MHYPILIKRFLAASFTLALCVGCNSPNVTAVVNTALVATPTPVPGCPTNYVLVPGNTSFGTIPFCIAKYEAKNVSGLPESQAAALPWASVTRDQAKAACASKGSQYSLVDNAHWMTVARNIESVSWNWGGDASLSENGMSRGITNNNGTVPFTASSDDNNSCYQATQSSGGAASICDLNTYDVARRVQKLDNGSLIWDFAGNVSEWISDDFTANYGVTDWVLNVPNGIAKDLLGPSGTYPAGPAHPTGNIFMNNFGYLSSNVAAGAVVARGGGWNYGRYAGIYTAYFAPATTAGTDNGFRCMFSL
jgi:hypothetical protein